VKLEVRSAIEQIDEEDHPHADPKRGQRAQVDAEQSVQERRPTPGPSLDRLPYTSRFRTDQTKPSYQ
jgi:hypothetical protein